jgi:hypothetical protein
MTHNKDSKIILTDCDGVVLWWEQAFHEWMQSRGHVKLYSNTYSLHEHYEGLSAEQAMRDIIEFNGSSWMLSLPAFRDARVGVARLVEAGYKFHAITAMGTDPYAKELRQMNLDRLFGHDVFVDLTVVKLNGDKRAALEPYRGSGLPWVEDSSSHATDGFNMGLDVYLMDHLYNQDDVWGTKRVSCWSDICNFILDSD